MGSYNLNNFTLDEFDSPDHKGSGINMQQSFLVLLDQARDIAGTPFKITSGYRTAEHNAKVGGVPNSSHTKGYAADIAITSSLQRYIILNALLKVGFDRVGIADSFLHVDNDPEKSKAVWTY
jgi:zinc D-Ala-D-Ala carboxypeptidase